MYTLGVCVCCVIIEGISHAQKHVFLQKKKKSSVTCIKCTVCTFLLACDNSTSTSTTRAVSPPNYIKPLAKFILKISASKRKQLATKAARKV